MVWNWIVVAIFARSTNTHQHTGKWWEANDATKPYVLLHRSESTFSKIIHESRSVCKIIDNRLASDEKTTLFENRMKFYRHNNAQTHSCCSFWRRIMWHGISGLYKHIRTLDSVSLLCAMFLWNHCKISKRLATHIEWTIILTNWIFTINIVRFFSDKMRFGDRMREWQWPRSQQSFPPAQTKKHEQKIPRTKDIHLSVSEFFETGSSSSHGYTNILSLSPSATSTRAHTHIEN